MGLTMKERKSVMRETAVRHQKLAKKQKRGILDEFVVLTGYIRCYASYLLRNHGKKVRANKGLVIIGDIRKKAERKRPKTYGSKVFDVLKTIWLIMDCICSKRLAPVLKDIVLKLEKHKEIEIDEETKK